MIIRLLLLFVIYIGFVGLGLPDSLFGAAWPAIYNEFGLHLSTGSLITVATTLFTIVSSMKSALVIKRFGTARVAFFSTLLTVIALLGISLTGSFWFICLCALPLGLGAGSIDTALNNYVAQHYNASQMSFLHCFYGIGVTLSPFLLSLAMNDADDWRAGYSSVFWLQLSIAIVLVLSIPLWGKVRHPKGEDDESETLVLGLKEVARIPGVTLSWSLFFLSVAIEMTTGAWGSTYLVEHLGLSVSEASAMIMYYFLGIAIGRFGSGVLASRVIPMTILKGCVVVLGVAMLLLLVAPSSWWIVAGLFMVGLGNGPIFPNLSCQTPQIFGSRVSASVIGSQIAICNVSWLIMPVVCSLLGEGLGMWIFPYYLALLFVGLLIALVRFVSLGIKG